MMDFPNSPSDGQIVAQPNGITYRWNAAKTRWDAVVNQTQQVVAVGMVAAFAESVSDPDWLFCDGAAVSRTAYPNLFAKIGVMYGAGDGSTTFNLPDYRGQFMRGQDAGAGVDPDAGSRTNRGDGVTGDAVGTKQDDEVGPHNHTATQPTHTHTAFQAAHTHSLPNVLSFTGTTNNFQSGSNAKAATATGSAQPAVTVNAASAGAITVNANAGSESRPKNINVRYYIFAGATMGVQSLFIRESAWTMDIFDNDLTQKGQTYAVNACYYWRIGNMVKTWGEIKMSSLGSLVGTQPVRLHNWPFTVSGKLASTSINIGYFDSFGTFIDNPTLSGYITGGAPVPQGIITASGLLPSTVASIVLDELTANGRFFFTCDYITDDQ